MSSRADTYGERVELDNFLQEGAARLASFPSWEPNTNDWPFMPVQTLAGATGRFYDRCHNMQLLSIDEQNDQMRYIEIVKELVSFISELENDSTASSNPMFKKIKKEIDNVFLKAKHLHKAQRTKTIGQQVLNTISDMGRSINERVEDLQVTIGVKRALDDNSDFDSSDDENFEPNNKKHKTGEESPSLPN